MATNKVRPDPNEVRVDLLCGRDGRVGGATASEGTIFGLRSSQTAGVPHGLSATTGLADGRLITVADGLALDLAKKYVPGPQAVCSLTSERARHHDAALRTIARRRALQIFHAQSERFLLDVAADLMSAHGEDVAKKKWS